MRACVILWLSLAGVLSPALQAASQSSNSDLPSIIRDTDIAEGVEQAEPPKERNPAEADKNIEVGNFYYKQKNYVGALGRYLVALEYQPDSASAYKAVKKAYNSLVKALAKSQNSNERIQQAVDFIQGYLRNSPDSARREEFQEKIRQLQGKISRPAK
jgi:tetratricopeptide (TPR) repeat protein